MPDQKIQKALADAGIGSRRAVEALVAAGRVQINGRTARIGDRVDAERDTLAVDGRRVDRPAQRAYLVMAKPAGVTSTVTDRHAARTVLDAVPPELRSAARRLYPVGRLDRDSEGLLLLTDDGEWANQLLHPRYGVEREYAVAVPAPLDPEQIRRLENGVELAEGSARLASLRPATRSEVATLERSVGRTPGGRSLYWYRATLTQGWRRQLRRMFAAVEAPIERLVRVRIGSLWLGDMKLGDVRPLTPAELARLDSDPSAVPTQDQGNITIERGEDPGDDYRGGRGGGDGDAGEDADGERPSRRGARESRGTRGTRADRGGEPRGPGRPPVVSLDGPASSGKSTVGAGAATRLGYRFCDTGLLYRALTWLALGRGVDLADPEALVALVPEVGLSTDAMGRLSRVRVAERDVTARVQTGRVDSHVSEVARHPRVREALLPVQRALAVGGGILMAGRDIGTVVLPDADVKLYLDVSLEERARRRAEERGVDPDGDEGRRILDEMRRRDEIDSTRPTSPLRVPDGAEVIRSDGKRVEETIDAVVAAVRRAAGDRHP